MHRLDSDLLLGGRYRLDQRISSGGMGDVWRAQDVVLQRWIAVKVMRPAVSSDREFATRFQAEARYAAGLSHSNIATVFDYGEYDDLAYLVMELVDGQTLADLLDAQGRLGPATVRSVMAQAALALAAAHEARLVHRDIKPANIIVNQNGQVKLTDFGIARAIDAVSHTQTGSVMGTPRYISPEQAYGARATGSSDLYSLGVVGFEMLTGEYLFDRETPVATMFAHVNDPIPALPPDLPHDLREVISQCLEKDPARRPSSGREIAARFGVVEAVNRWGIPDFAAVVSDAVDHRQPQPPVEGPERTTTMPPIPAVRERSPTPMSEFATAPFAFRDWLLPMEPLHDLEMLLANLKPRLNSGEFAFVSVTKQPDGLRPYMTLLEPEGVTMLVTVQQAQEHGLAFELPVAWLTMGVYRSIAAQGYVPTLTTALAQAHIASLVSAGRWHTHIFVPAAQAEQALKVLTRLSRAHRDDD